MNPDDPVNPVTRWARDLRSPDARVRDEAARRIYDGYAGRLLALARRHLDDRVRRREDEGDVLQAMYQSFCRMQRDAAESPADRNQLVALMVRILLRKAADAANRHTAARRDVRREQPAGAESADEFPVWMLDHMARSEPTPADAALFSEELEHRLGSLDEGLREVAILKLEGHTNEAIAARIGRTTRAVELKLQRIRAKWAPAAGAG